MRIDHCDYTKLVFAAFKKRQCDNVKPQLPVFTRASIKQECLNVYDKRKSKGGKVESKVLQDFFGVPEDGQNWRDLIELFPLDKFRPLENFMRGGIQNPDMANVELLAWLIDFKHRPYVFGKDVLLSEEELDILNKKGEPNILDSPDSNLKETKSQESLPNEGKTKRNRQLIKVAAVVLLGLGLAGGATYIQGKGASPEKKLDSFSSPNNNTQPVEIYNVANIKKADTLPTHLIPQTNRCLKITRKGTQCKRTASNGSYCWQHG